MNKIYAILICAFFFLCVNNAHSATWEKLFCKKSTDCFRSVYEVPSGGYVLGGYTANLNSNDTDGYVVRMDVNGDTIWTFTYNGPSSKEDLFYKAIPTQDGGFILCGYSKSFGNGENAIYAKLNSNGQLQWINNWGGSGIEHPQDIIQLPDGKYAMCGYSTTSPARYYDAFILKIDQSGNTIWSKLYGTTNYDDANSIKVLPDNGLIIGGQSNNQLYLVRTNSSGDAIWTQTYGTSGIDNIQCVNFTQSGDGFLLAGTTDGPSNGGEDAYLIKTDTGGAQIWAKTYGGSLNDGFHRIEHTSDGGYVGIGTSDQSSLTDPNLWIVKLDVTGNLTWEKFFGGDDHDHGYSGQQTSDGGFIITGHTHSFMSNDNKEDGIVIKTNSSGTVSSELTWTTVTELTTPVVTTCGSPTAQIKVEIANYGVSTVSNIPVTIEITGAITQTLTQTYPSSVAPGAKKSLTFTTTVDMSGGGTFNFHCYTGNPHDIYPAQNYLDESLTVGGTLPPTVNTGSHCGPGAVTLSATSPTPVQWFAASSGGSSLGTGLSFTTPYIPSTTTYYAQSGGSCQSARVPVSATILAGISTPNPTNGSRCGPGTVSLSASSSYTIKWYSSNTSTTILYTGTNFTTPSLSTNTTYYIQADNSTCTSNRVAITASIVSPPNVPVATPAARCSTGTVTLTATSPVSMEWYDAATGGNLLDNGTSFTTPVISTTTTFYVLADNGTCKSARVPVIATVSSTPPNPVTSPGNRCGTGTVVLTATAANPIKWYNAPTGGSLVGSGTSLTTPSISSTTTFYAVADNGCMSNRVPAIATINTVPSSPVTTGGNRCGSGSVVLSATASNPLLWYSAATGGSSIASGNTFTTPVITTTKTYYVSSDNGCLSPRVAVIATINAIPAVPVTVSVARCSTGTVVLTATATSPIVWYNAATGGSQVGTGSSFTTPVLTTTTTYYALSNSGTCSSNRVTAVATISSTPANPVTTPGSRCGTGTVALTATSTAPVKWFSSSTSSTVLGTGTSFTTPSISVTETFYAMADNGCVSSRVLALATVNTVPSAPVTTSAENCGSSLLILTATGSNPIVWFDALSGGTQVGSGTSFTTPLISTTTTYYAMTDNGLCKSIGIPAVATILPVPTDPIVPTAGNCGDGIVELIATSTDSLTWYDAMAAGNILGTGNTYTTPLISTSTTYYLQAHNEHCIGNMIAVTANINPFPIINLGSDTIYSSTPTYMFDAGPGYSSYLWSTSVTSETYMANAAGNYCVTVTDDNNCTGTDCVYLEFTVGVENNLHENSFALYPSPSHGMITIDWSGNHSEFQLTIVDLTGKTVYNNTLYTNKKTLDLSLLSEGIYLVKISDDKTTLMKRLVIE